MVDIEQVMDIKLFKDFSVTEIERILGIANFQSFKIGETIIRENVVGKELYVIIEGEVRISKLVSAGESVNFAILRRGNFFGELSLLTQKAHSATAEAVENTQVMTINKTDFDKFVETDPQAGFKMLKSIICEISELLKQMNDKFIDMMEYMWR